MSQAATPTTRHALNRAATKTALNGGLVGVELHSHCIQRMDTFASSLSSAADDASKHADPLYWPQWTWPLILNDHVSVESLVECFLKSSHASTPFHQRSAQEALRFYSDSMSDDPIHVLRLEHDVRLRLRMTPEKDLPFDVENVVSFSVKPPGEGFVPLEMVLNRVGNTVELVALLQPSAFRSKDLHVVSPLFRTAKRTYVKLTVRVQMLLGFPFCQQVDLYCPVYCKIVHPRSKLRIFRMLRLFENQKEHDVNA